MDIKEFNEAIEKLFNIKTINEDKFKYTYECFDGDTKFILTKKEFKESVNKLNNLKSENHEIYNETGFEVSVIETSRTYLRNDDVKQEDPVNKITYLLAKCSNEYLIQTIKELLNLPTEIVTNNGYIAYKIRTKGKLGYNRNHSTKEKDEKNDLFEFIKEILPQFKTLKITSESSQKKIDFTNLSNAFFFNIAYNTNKSYLPISINDNISKETRIRRMRDVSMQDIQAPKVLYNNDIILFYQKALSSESVDLQYLSFYHILEHFFETIYNENIIERIRTELTNPGFSYKKDADIMKIRKVITDKLKYQKEEFVLNEGEALELVLKKFIPNLGEIKNEIEIYDKKLLEFYKKHEVIFAKGDKIDFEITNNNIYKNLRDRIYKTRNSIVHSKEQEKDSRYLPFKHDQSLQKEIPLIRIIAENIIIANSKII